MLDIILKKPMPRQWKYYSTANSVINLINSSNRRIDDDLRSNIYINDRLTGGGSFIDKLIYKVGKQYLTNRLQSIKLINLSQICPST